MATIYNHLKRLCCSYVSSSFNNSYIYGNMEKHSCKAETILPDLIIPHMSVYLWVLGFSFLKNQVRFISFVISPSQILKRVKSNQILKVLFSLGNVLNLHVARTRESMLCLKYGINRYKKLSFG